MNPIQDSVDHNSSSPDTGSAGALEPSKGHPKTTLMSLPNDLLLVIFPLLHRTNQLSALSRTNRRFCHIAREVLHKPKGKRLIKSIKKQMHKAIETGNESYFSQMITHVNAPWSAFEVAKAINQRQGSMALRLLGNESIKKSVVQVTNATGNNNSHPFIKALTTAVVTKMYDLLRAIFKVEGINPNVRCPHGGTLLHKYPNDFKARQVLLECGVDAALTMLPAPHTTLEYALNDAKSFELLIKWGARPSDRDLALVLDWSNVDVLEVILRWDLDPNGEIAAEYDDMNRAYIHQLRREAQPPNYVGVALVQEGRLEWAMDTLSEVLAVIPRRENESNPDKEAWDMLDPFAPEWAYDPWELIYADEPDYCH